MKQVGWKTPDGRFVALRMNVEIIISPMSVSLYTVDSTDDPHRLEWVGWVDVDAGDGGIYPTSGVTAHRKAVYAERPAPPVMQHEHVLLSNRDADRMREDIAALKKDLADLTRTVSDQSASRIPAEPPMSFYDHAFIAAYIAANETMNRDMATKDAHDTASHLTRNRANRP